MAGSQNDATERLLGKLRDFVVALDDDEREVLAALIGPGVALAYRESDDVEAFGMTWEPQRLPEHLAETVRAHQLRIIGL
jgi:serine/threonine protein kinase HipA of HipAB toxin-antitoxin module